jgi:hypothetical protein
MNRRVSRIVARWLWATAGVLPASRATALPPEPEHTIWITVESNPSVADLYTVPADTNKLPVRLGTTPCTIAVDLSWGSRWFKKRWDLISISSPADTCRAVVQSNSPCQILFPFVAMKRGFKTREMEAPVAMLPYPGPDWSGKRDWPIEKKVLVELEPERRAFEKPALRRALVAGMMSSGELRPTGVLTIHVDVPSAEVLVDQQNIGKAPVQITLPAGMHRIMAQKPGFVPAVHKVHVAAGAEAEIRLTLPPE